MILHICVHFMNYKCFHIYFIFSSSKTPMTREGKANLSSIHIQGKQCSERLDDLL